MSAFPPSPAPPGQEAWPGLDVASGLANVSHRPPLYRKLLRSYHDANQAIAQKLDEAMAAGDGERLNRLVHTLKGTSGTLGICAVHAAAIAFERAGGAEGAQGLELLDRLKLAQTIALDTIERYLAVD